MGMFGAYTEAELAKKGSEADHGMYGTRPIAQATWKHKLYAGSFLYFFKPGFFSRHRLLDGYIGILGIILHYRLMAIYFSTLDVFSLSLRVFKWSTFHIGLSYDPFPLEGKPAWKFVFNLFHMKWRKEWAVRKLKS